MLGTYFRTWFLFDASLVTLDILTISAAGILAAEPLTLHLLRQHASLCRDPIVPRAARPTLTAAAEDVEVQLAAAGSGSLHWAPVADLGDGAEAFKASEREAKAIANTSAGILVVAHLLTCFWFYMGRTIEATKSSIYRRCFQEAGNRSWVTMSEASTIQGRIGF